MISINSLNCAQPHSGMRLRVVSSIYRTYLYKDENATGKVSERYVLSGREDGARVYSPTMNVKSPTLNVNSMITNVISLSLI